MGIKQKAFSIGASAALLASLFTAVAAPAVFATSAVTNGGTIYRGGPASAAITFSFNEDTVNQWADGSATLTMKDSAAGTTIKFSGTPVCTATGTPGISCTAAVSGAGSNILTITVAGTSSTRTDGLTVTGLKVKAGATAPTGAVTVAATADTIGLSTVSQTASGTVGVGGTTATDVPFILNTGSPAFQVTDTVNGISNLSIGAPNAESVAITVVGASLTTAAQSFAHPQGATLTQTVVNPFNATVATVGDTTTLSSAGTATFVQNVNNQTGSLLTLDLGYAGYVVKGTVITFSIVTPDVQFSNLAGLGSWEGVSNGTSVLSLDRRTITYTTGSTTTVDGSVVTYGSSGFDIGNVPNGTPVEVAATVGALHVNGSPATVGTVGTTLVGFSASQPPANILIGSNDQTTALLTLRELAAGTLQDELSATDNGFKICITSDNASFSRAPWAVVTAGDLKLNNAGAAATQLAMTWITNDCYGFRVFSQSTVASTIEIRGGADAANTTPLPSGPTNGPRISVPYNELPSQVYIQGWIVDTGTSATANYFCDGTCTAVGVPVVVAYLTYANAPKVIALSAPYMAKGGVHQLAGSLQITEGYPGQFTTGYINVCLPQSSMANSSPAVNFSGFSDIQQYAASDLPRIDTNNAASGMTAYFNDWTTFSTSARNWLDVPCFELYVDHGSLTAPGVITISNILYDVKSDAPNGPIQVEVSNYGDAYNHYYGDTFDTTVVNANIGVQPTAAFKVGTALGATKNATFTAKTKIAKLSGYVTWRFTGPAALAGKIVTISISTKQADGTWGAFVVKTSRFVDLNGNAYYWLKSAKATWLAIRATYAGDATYALSTSASPQARWMK